MALGVVAPELIAIISAGVGTDVGSVTTGVTGILVGVLFTGSLGVDTGASFPVIAEIIEARNVGCGGGLSGWVTGALGCETGGETGASFPVIAEIIEPSIDGGGCETGASFDVPGCVLGTLGCETGDVTVSFPVTAEIIEPSIDGGGVGCTGLSIGCVLGCVVGTVVVGTVDVTCVEETGRLYQYSATMTTTITTAIIMLRPDIVVYYGGDKLGTAQEKKHIMMRPYIARI